MRNTIKISMVFITLTFLNNCINIGNYEGFGPTGALYNRYKVGLSGSDKISASKEGKACVQKFSVFATFGDGSIQEAASSVGIKRIASVDKEAFGIINPYIYQRLCTIVRGD